MKKLVSILILAFCVLGMSAQNVVMKVKVNGNQVAEREDGTRIELSGVLTLPKDAFSEISFFEKSMQVEASTPEVNRTNVTIPLKFEGDPLSDITQWGIRYALSEEKLENDYTGDAKDGAPANKETSYSLSGLTANTTYFGQAFALFNDEIILSNVVSFTTGAADNDSIPIPEAVDLGLPSGTKWASWNLGATKPEEAGRYCGWGDKTAYLKERGTSHYADGLDFESIAGNEKYDPATYQWQGQWRMPTEADFKELYKYCPPRLDAERKVLVFEGLNGNSITIPLAGTMSSISYQIEGVGSVTQSYYWLAETEPTNPTYPQYMNLGMHFTENSVGFKARYNLYQIRPVYGPVVPDGSGGGTTPDNPDPTVDEDAWKKISDYAYDNEGNKISAIPADGVDLGLPSGTKWAAWNVGTLDVNTKKEEFGIGRYYAWGDTIWREEYSQLNYASYYKDKYCRDLPTEHDIAAKMWGKDWQTPSMSDFLELFEQQSDGAYRYVTVTWVDIKAEDLKGNPIYGYKVTSKKYPDNYIILPAAGYQLTLLLNNPPCGHYWTKNGSTLSGKTLTSSNCASFSQGTSVSVASLDRYFGCQIRPVKKKK